MLDGLCGDRFVRLRRQSAACPEGLLESEAENLG